MKIPNPNEGVQHDPKAGGEDRLTDISAFVDGAWRDLLEKDDRTSPEGYPDMALITHDELASIIFTASAIEAGGESIEPQTDWLAAKIAIARADGWREAVIVARQASLDFIPRDWNGEQLHKFAAETIVKAVEQGASHAGVRFAEASQAGRKDGSSKPKTPGAHNA
jgi:hypothetical protein